MSINNTGTIKGIANMGGAITATIGTGGIIINDWMINIKEIDGGHRLIASRGSEVKTMDVMDGKSFSPRGVYNPSQSYEQYDVVVHDLNLYVALKANHGETPGSGNAWRMLIDNSAVKEAAENANKAAENARKAQKESNDAEALRNEAETKRINAENERGKKEVARETAEEARSLAEQHRTDEEIKRIAFEKERAEKENDRAIVEAKHIAAEKERAEAEITRVNAEKSRSAAETQRGNAEVDRAAAEEARAKAESNRGNAETARREAEANRADAETVRNAAEDARAKAEVDRVSNEAARQAQLTEAVDNAEKAAGEAEAARDEAYDMFDVIAKEPTAQQILDVMMQELALLKQIVDEGIAGGGDLNGFSFGLGENGEFIISYVNPEDETDTAIATFATKIQAQEIAQTLFSTNTLLRSMVVGVEAIEETEA